MIKKVVSRLLIFSLVFSNNIALLDVSVEEMTAYEETQKSNSEVNKRQNVVL